MIEQIMVFALGFLFSGLLTLLFLPALWRRALRLSRRRLEMQMPLSMDEIVAERDQLRAEFAVDRRRIEQAAEALQRARANDMSELGRRAVSLAALGDEVAQVRAQLAETQALAASAQTQAAVLLQETEERLQETEERLNALCDAQRVEISALETNVESLRINIADLEGAHERTSLQLEQANAALETAAREAESLRAQAASQNQGSASAALDDAAAEGDELVRQAIAQLGAEVLRMTGPARAPAMKSAQTPASAAAGSKPARAAAAGE